MTKAQQAQLSAEAQCNTSRKAHTEAGEANLGMYKEVTDSLAKKVQISHGLLDALRWRAGVLTAAITAARQSLAKLETALAAKEGPLKLCNWHMEERKARPRRELVRDIVEEQLEEERAIILDAQKKLSDAIRRTKALILELEAKLQEVRHDMDCKTQAVGIDEMCLRSADASFNTVLMHTERPTSAGRTVKLSRWRRPDDHPAVRDSRNNELVRERKVAYLVGSTDRQEEGAKAMYDEHDRLMFQCARAVDDAAARLEQAVQVRLKENQRMRDRLDAELKETEAKIDDTMNTIAETRFQITALEEPVDLADICGSWRQRRADPERLNDHVTTRLADHQVEASKARRELVMHQQSIHSKLQHLQECRDHLTEDIADKLTAYNIDHACLTTRTAQSTPGGTTGLDEPPFFAMPLRNEYMDATPPAYSLPNDDMRPGSSAGSAYSVPRSEFPGPRSPPGGATALRGGSAPLGRASPTPSGASTPVSLRSGRSLHMAKDPAASPPLGASTTVPRSRHSQASSTGVAGAGFRATGLGSPLYPIRPAMRDAWPSIPAHGRPSTPGRPVTAR